MRVLAVDHGSKRIGLAVSDTTGTIANPLQVVAHTARAEDARKVAAIAAKNEAGLIVVGQSLGDDGQPNFEGRRAGRFADALRLASNLPVVMWDEALTTQEARSARLVMGAKRKDRTGHLDALAATVLLQSYLDGQR